MFKNLSIRTKLFLMAAAVSIPAVAVVLGLANMVGRSMIKQATFDHLTSVRSAKATQVESYLRQIRAQVRTSSEDLMVVEAMGELSAAFQSFREQSISEQEWASLRAYYSEHFLPRLQARERENIDVDALLPEDPAAARLQQLYIVDNPYPVDAKDEFDRADDGGEYSALHATYHPLFRDFVSSFGFYDLFLIDTNGHIVYSVFKETDFATGLNDGPHRESNLAAAFKAVIDAPSGDAVYLVDFARYGPSYGAPASFIASPIERSGERLGVLAFQMPVGEIERIMTGDRNWEEDGLGETGETYLVGSDYTMRSDSRFLLEAPETYMANLAAVGTPESVLERIRSYQTSILLQEVRTQAVNRAFEGNSDTAIIDDYRGAKVLSSWAPLALEDVKWTIVAEIDVAEAFASSSVFTKILLLALVGITLLVLLLSSVFSRVFVAPILALEDGAQRYASGDREVEIPISSGDELGRLTESFNQMVEAINLQNRSLEESETRIRAILESAADGIITITQRGTITSFNQAAERIFGYTAGEVGGRNINILVPSPHSEQHDSYLKNYLKTGEAKIIGNGREVEGMRKDGSTFPLYLNVSEVKINGSRSFTGIVRDITERKLAEAELAKYRERLEQLVEERTAELRKSSEKVEAQKELLENTLESLTHPFYVIDAEDYTIKMANSSARKLGIGTETKCHKLTHKSDTPCDSVEDPCPLVAVKKSKQPVVLEHVHFDSDGNRYFVEVHGYPIFDQDGNVVQMIEYSLDITERKKMQMDLEEAKGKAEQANRAKSSFLANMSHELRTPMNAIIGYSEMLAEDAEDEGHDEMIPDLEKINAAGKHLLALINDILDLSKIEAGRMDLFLERFDLRQMLDEAVHTVKPLLDKNGNQILTEIADDIGAVRADLTKLRQTLFNLLSNAAKFTDKGTIALAAQRQDRAGVDWVVITVTDSGIGISAEKIDHVFEEFSQADDSTTREYGGTGLGLPISRRFCRMMGGELSATSRPGEGSTFTVELPVTVDAMEAAKTATKTIDAGVGEIPESVTGHPILVIDDEANARDLLERTLVAEGFEVLTAASGAAGLELARSVRPSLITLDVMMPEMDGWAVLKELKADQALRHIPVMMVSMVDEHDQGFTLGAVEYLTKPVDREKLRQVVGFFAGSSQAGHALVVDDDETMRSMFRRSLEADGWTVDDAENGAVGLRLAEETLPDLVVLDLMMPVMDGFDFVIEFRAREECRSVPIVVITAMDLTEEDQSRLAGGVERIIQKGALTRQQLLAEVQALVVEHAAPLRKPKGGEGES